MDEYLTAATDNGWVYVGNKAGHAVYHDADGKEVYLEFKTRKVRRTAEWWLANDPRALTLDYWWEMNHERMVEKWGEKVLDPTSLRFCHQCRWVRLASNFTDDEYDWCDSCVSTLPTCPRCDTRCGYLYTVLGGHTLCEPCRDDLCHWCEGCEEHYLREDSDLHRHAGCECESPRQTFTIRNDGHPRLANDTRVKVSLPAGVISDEGIGEIARYLRDVGLGSFDSANRRNYALLSYNLAEIGLKWQMKDGNYTKRLSRYAYQRYGLKLSPDVMSQIGNIGSDHSRGIDFDVEVTRNLNLPREEFANEGSCWWTDYADSRCAFKSNGGFGLRTFTEPNINGHSYCNGRAWVIPLRWDVEYERLVQTFDTDTPTGFITFNGYGTLEGYTAPRLLGHMVGLTYRKIVFHTGDDESGMYVNSDIGYLVAPESIADRYNESGERSTSLILDCPTHATLIEKESSHV